MFPQENEDEQASGPIDDSLGPQRPRSNSGRELTDEVHIVVSVSSIHPAFSSFCRGLLLSTHTFLSVCFKFIDWVCCLCNRRSWRVWWSRIWTLGRRSLWSRQRRSFLQGSTHSHYTSWGGPRSTSRKNCSPITSTILISHGLTPIPGIWLKNIQLYNHSPVLTDCFGEDIVSSTHMQQYRRYHRLFLFFSVRNDAAQSDDDDRGQAPLTDTDGGKLKQKT